MRLLDMSSEFFGPRHLRVSAGVTCSLAACLLLVFTGFWMDDFSKETRLVPLTIGLPLGLLGIVASIHALKFMDVQRRNRLSRVFGDDFIFVILGMVMQLIGAAELIFIDIALDSVPLIGFLTFLFATCGMLISIIYFGGGSRTLRPGSLNLDPSSIRGIMLIILGIFLYMASDGFVELEFFNAEGANLGISTLGIIIITFGLISLISSQNITSTPTFIKIKTYFSAERATGVARDKMEDAIQKMKQLNDEGVRHHESGDYNSAVESFTSALKTSRMSSRHAQKDELSDLRQFISTLNASISESLEHARNGIAQQDIEQEMNRLEVEISRLEEFEEDPLKAKRGARQCESDVEALYEKSNEFGFDSVGKICLSMLNRIRNVSKRADEELMGGIVAAQAVAEPRFTSTGGTAPQQVADSTVQERYSIGELIAEGGMAKVFRATEMNSSRIVVWKQAHGRHNPLAVSNQKLNDEAELLQVANHPRIPTYLAHGGVVHKGEQTAVLVQEFIKGGDLKNTVEQVKKVGANIPLEKIIEYISGICEPLEHMAGLPEPVYHRDLKPHNVIMHPDRGPVLIDFGLAKMVATGEDVSITRGGSGTWTPPERDAGVSGPFTDVYSLGKILYYLLTKKNPPAILTMNKVSAISEAGHPEWLEKLTLTAAWPDREKRIQTVEQFRKLLNNEGKWEDGTVAGPGGSDDFTTWG